MSRIVALSSYVAHGHIGLGAIVPALTAMGCEAIALPTVVLSNHAGHAHSAGFQVPVAQLEAMQEALQANGRLREVDAVLTGYLPTPEHVHMATRLIAAVRRASPSALIVCDPVAGDEPKGLYICEQAARALRDELLPLADIATPNAFELAWFADRPASTCDQAVAAARCLPCACTVATSVPDGPGRLATVLVDGDRAVATSTERLPGIPNGTGDLLAGLLTGYLARGEDRTAAFAGATAMLESVLTVSTGRDELDLSPLGQPTVWTARFPLRAIADH